MLRFAFFGLFVMLFDCYAVTLGMFLSPESIGNKQLCKVLFINRLRHFHQKCTCLEA